MRRNIFKIRKQPQTQLEVLDSLGTWLLIFMPWLTLILSFYIDNEIKSFSLLNVYNASICRSDFACKFNNQSLEIYIWRRYLDYVDLLITSNRPTTKSFMENVSATSFRTEVIASNIQESVPNIVVTSFVFLELVYPTDHRHHDKDRILYNYHLNLDQPGVTGYQDYFTIKITSVDKTYVKFHSNRTSISNISYCSYYLLMNRFLSQTILQQLQVQVSTNTEIIYAAQLFACGLLSISCLVAMLLWSNRMKLHSTAHDIFSSKRLNPPI